MFSNMMSRLTNTYNSFTNLFKTNNEKVLVDSIYKEFSVAMQNRDFDKMKQMKEENKEINSLESIVDISFENGDGEMFKFLVNEFGAQPSLYAKQMASINNHNDLVTWTETMDVPLRNKVGIHSVHYKYNKDTNKLDWDDCIPSSYRFT